jgi:hypothetical protein
MSMQRQHDLGGLPAGPIDTSDHPTEPWAKLINGILGALRERGLMRVDELRRALEDLSKEDYDKPYFERWAVAISNLLEEKGLATHEEIRTRMDDIRKRLEAGR